MVWGGQQDIRAGGEASKRIYAAGTLLSLAEDAR